MAPGAERVTLDDVSTSPSQPPLPRFPGVGANGPLRRSRRQRVVGGVAGGIAEYLGIDVAIVRIALVVASLTMGFPMLLYPLAMIVIPKAPAENLASDGLPCAGRPARRSSLGAVVLIAVGVMLLLDRIGLHLRGDLLWPLALIGIGAAVLWSRRQNDDRTSTTMSGTIPTGGVGDVTNSFATAGATATATATSPVHGFGDDLDEHPFSALERNPVVQRAYERPTPTPVDPTVRVDVPRRPGRSFYARSGFAFFMLTVGVGALAVRAGGIDLSVTRALSYALLWLGGLLFLGAFLGRPRLSLLGGLLAAVVVVSSAVQIDVRGGVGERFVTPLSAQEIEPSYRLGLGSMQLDLSNAALSRTTTVKADVSVGELVVTVPDDVRVVADVDAQLGSATLFGEQYDGTIHERVTAAVASRAPSTAASSTASIESATRTTGEGVTLRLDLGVGVGEIVVQRASERIRGVPRNGRATPSTVVTVPAPSSVPSVPAPSTVPAPSSSKAAS